MSSKSTDAIGDAISHQPPPGAVMQGFKYTNLDSVPADLKETTLISFRLFNVNSALCAFFHLLTLLCTHVVTSFVPLA